MRRLAGVADLGDPVADQAVELGEARAGAAVVDRARRRRASSCSSSSIVLAASARRGRGSSCGRTSSRRRRPRSRTASARAPARAGRRSRVNVRIPGPDQTSEKPSASSTLPSQPVPSPWTNPFQSAAASLSFIPGRRRSATCSIAAGGDLVREPHALDLLRGLDRARRVEERRRVGRARAGVEPRLGERRRLADHAVGRLRAERELEADALVARCAAVERELERARGRRTRVALVVAGEEPDVARPGGARGVVGGGLEADQHRLALAREDDGVVALHPPEVREVEDVVGRADDERVEVLPRPSARGRGRASRRRAARSRHAVRHELDDAPGRHGD